LLYVLSFLLPSWPVKGEEEKKRFKEKKEDDPDGFLLSPASNIGSKEKSWGEKGEPPAPDSGDHH